MFLKLITDKFSISLCPYKIANKVDTFAEEK